MELKSRKNVLCLIVVGLLDLSVRCQSDVTGGERRGVFGDLRVSLFLQSGKEESQSGWCVVLSFISVSVSLSWSSGLWIVVCLLSICSAVEKFVFYIIFLFWLDQIRFSLLQRSWIGPKITLIIFIFWQISLTFRYALILCTEAPFFHFEESLSTDNIRWMLSWALVAIIILYVWWIRKRSLSLI